MKAINKTKNIVTGLVALFTVGFTNPSFSQSKSESPIEIRVIGNINDSPLFQFTANNTEVSAYLIKVKDADGNLLYSESLKGKNVWRKYRIDITKEDLDDAFKVRFEVTNLKSHETFVYNATRNSRVVEDIVVAKL